MRVVCSSRARRRPQLQGREQPQPRHWPRARRHLPWLHQEVPHRACSLARCAVRGTWLTSRAHRPPSRTPSTRTTGSRGRTSAPTRASLSSATTSRVSMRARKMRPLPAADPARQSRTRCASRLPLRRRPATVSCSRSTRSARSPSRSRPLSSRRATTGPSWSRTARARLRT